MSFGDFVFMLWIMFLVALFVSEIKTPNNPNTNSQLLELERRVLQLEKR